MDQAFDGRPLRPYLDEVFHQPSDGAEFVITRYRKSNVTTADD